MNASTKVIVVLAIVVATIVVSVWRFMNPPPDRSIVQAASELAQAKAEIEALGLTLDPVEFGRRLYVPVEDNAAPIIRDVASDVYTLGGFDALFSGDDHVEKCVDFDLWHPDVLERLRLAASKPGCDFQRDWSDSLAILFPEYASIKEMVNYCTFLAEADAEKRRYGSALEKLLIADSIASFADRDPTIFGHLVAIAGKSIIAESVIRILISEPNNPDVHRLLRDYASQANPLANPASGLAGELIMASTIFDKFWFDEWKMAIDDEEMSRAISTVEGRVFADASLAVYLQYFEEMYRIISSAASWDDILADVETFETLLDKATSPSDMFMQMVRPVESQFVKSHGRAAGMAEMLLLVADVLKRASENGLQAAVAELDGTVYDQINGGTFRIVVADPGFKVYTIGFDGIDSGGPEKVGRNISHDENVNETGYWIPYESD